MSEEKNIPSENNPAPHPMPIPAPEQTPAPQPEPVQQPVSSPVPDPAIAPAPVQAPNQQMPVPQPVMPGQPAPMPGQPVPMPMGQPGVPGAMPGGISGQPPIPPVPPMPGQAGGMPPRPPFGGGPVPPPITPLVLGILSIIFSILFAVVGLVLGIIAIVSGNKQLKSYGEAFAPKAKPGRMCGIIGVILSTINMVLAIAFTVFAFGVFSSSGAVNIDDFMYMDDDYIMEENGSYGELGATDEEFSGIVDGIMADILVDKDGYLEEGVAEFMDDMSDGEGHHSHNGDSDLSLFDVTDITAAMITEALLEDSSYEVTYCEAIDDVAMVEVTIYAKTLMTQYDTFMAMMEEYDAKHPGWDDSYENAAQVVGDVYMQSFAETAPSEIPLILTLENENGEWVLDDEDIEYIVNSMLYLS